jgi:hypothetical protein
MMLVLTMSDDSLHQKGLSISSSGVSIKTKGRMSREDYIDKTQRAFIDGMAKMQEAGSFGHADDIHKAVPSSPRVSPTASRQNSLPVATRKDSLTASPASTYQMSTSPIPSPSTPRRTMSTSSGGSGSVKFANPPGSPSPDEKKKKLGGLFTIKRRDSGGRSKTPF